MTVRVEVIQALPRACRTVALELDDGVTVADAVRAALARGAFDAGRVDSGRVDPGHVDPVRVDPGKVAIFGRAVPPTTVLSDGDRIELLRDLMRDPRDRRRERARS